MTIINFSREKIFKDVEFRSIKQQIFRYSPLTSQLLGEQITPLVKAFLPFAHEEKLSFNWTLPMHFLRWFAQHKEWPLTQEMIQEWMVASLIRWSLTGFDHVRARVLFVATPRLPFQAIGLKKGQEVSDSDKIVVLKLANSYAAHQDRYATGDEVNAWEGLIWKPLPH